MIKLTELSVDEKLKLICGEDFWHTNALGGKIERVRVTDATMGIRMPIDSASWDNVRPSVAYPSEQMLANSWDRDIVRLYAECVADDCLDAGADLVLGPGVNIKRSPLCGRNFEYFSEDPFLAGTLAKEYISAMQAEGAGACLKHFCANNLEYNRFEQSSDVDERTLREIYYEPFRIALEAEPVSVMSSYNRINGVYGSEYKKGYDVLRNEYGFKGLIMSDWDAVRDRVRAAKAGCDLEMPFHSEHLEQLRRDFAEGKISEEEIDKCAERVLDFISRTKELAKGKKRKHTLEERIAATRTVEENAVVLLKNNGVLPLKKGASLAVCGWHASPAFRDCRPRPDFLCGGGSGSVTRITPLFDMNGLLKQRGFKHISYEPAFSANGVDSSFMKCGIAVENAACSDVNVVFAGTCSGLESEGSDRHTMKLNPEAERAILETSAVNSATVVVLFAGSPIDMSTWVDKVAAIVWAGFPGEKGAEAVADVLCGKVNPSGKLSETFPISYDVTPAASGYADSSVTRYSEGLEVGYRYFDRHTQNVLFPFGHGLSYSQFEYGGLKTEKAGEKSVEVSFYIKNISATDGKEVAQIYVQPVAPRVFRPVKELKGFTKVFVKAGEKAHVELVLDEKAFSYYSTAKDCWTVDDGVYIVLIGSSSADIKLSCKIKIKNGELSLISALRKS